MLLVVVVAGVVVDVDATGTGCIEYEDGGVEVVLMDCHFRLKKASPRFS